MLLPCKSLRLLALGLALSIVIAGRADADSFTPAQRQEIIGIIRQAMKSDPSILSDAILSLRAQEDQSQARNSATAIKSNKTALAGAEGDYIAGNPNGDVTMVEFYDPRCPYCRKALPDLEALVAGNRHVRLVEKLIPILGAESLLQARAIAAAGRQNRYAAIQHALMEAPGQTDAATLRALAGHQGLNLAQWDRDMADPALVARLQSNVALAQSLGITGTPSFIVGGKLIPGAVSLQELRQAVAAARG